MPTILIDKAEKKPWKIPQFITRNQEVHRLKTKSIYLDTGDYLLEEAPSVAIERKGSLREVATNLGLVKGKSNSNYYTKADQPRFMRCLDRLSEFEHPYLIVEATLTAFLTPTIYVPEPELVLERLTEACVSRNISLQFIGTCSSVSAKVKAGTYISHLLVSHLEKEQPIG